MTPLVLIVEDIEDNLVLVRSLLEMGDFRVIEARNGRAAITEARQHRPDLILLDMSLPELDGWSVAKVLREDPAFASTLIVALTAHAMPGDREKCLEAGCDDFMTKPIDIPTFLPTVVKIMETRRG